MKLTAFIDGACRGNPGPASTGVVLRDDAGKTVEEFCRAIGVTTNNVAEYCALIDALTLACKRGADRILVHSDSKLLVEQVLGRWRVKNPKLAGLLRDIHKLKAGFASFEIVHVRREFNEEADAMANKALDAASI